MAESRLIGLTTDAEVAVGREVASKVTDILSEILGSKDDAAKIAVSDRDFLGLITNFSKQQVGTLDKSVKPVSNLENGIREILEARRKAAEQAAELATKAAAAATARAPQKQEFGPFGPIILDRVVEGSLITAATFNRMISGLNSHDGRLRALEAFASREWAVETLGFGRLLEQVRTLEQEVVFLNEELGVLRNSPHVPPEAPAGLRNLLLQMRDMAETLRNQQAEIAELQKGGTRPPRPPVFADPPVFVLPPRPPVVGLGIDIRPPREVLPLDADILVGIRDTNKARELFLEEVGPTDLIRMKTVGHDLTEEAAKDLVPTDLRGTLDIKAGSKPSEAVLEVSPDAGMKAADLTEVVVGDRTFKTGEFVATDAADGTLKVAVDISADKGTPIADLTTRAGMGVQVIGKSFSLGALMPGK